MDWDRHHGPVDVRPLLAAVTACRSSRARDRRPMTWSPRRPLGRLTGGRARGSDIVFTMVGVPADVREVYFGEYGIHRRAQAGRRRWWT